MGSGCLPINIMSSTSNRGQQSARDLPGKDGTGGQRGGKESTEVRQSSGMVKKETPDILTDLLLVFFVCVSKLLGEKQPPPLRKTFTWDIALKATLNPTY